MGMGVKPTATLLAQIVNDAHAGLVPQIAGPDRVLITNEDGTAVAWMLLTDFTQGEPGEDGRTILNGAGAPSGGTGIDGDFYIDTSASAIYGPKTAGAWGSPTSLIGPAGEVGATGPAGAAGVPSAPESGDNGRIPFALSEDLAYSSNLYYDDTLHVVADTFNATTVALHIAREQASSAISPIQRSPALEFEASGWNTDTEEATIQAYRMQVIPTTGTVPWGALVVEQHSGGGYVNALRLNGAILGLWDGSAWQDVITAIGGTVFFSLGAPAQFGDSIEAGGSLKIAGNFGANGATPARPTITGSRGGNAALASLLTALDSMGLITDATSA